MGAFIVRCTSPWMHTGRRRHRLQSVGFLRPSVVLVLQIEEVREEWTASAPPSIEGPPKNAHRVHRWRDATPQDVLPVEAP